MVHHHQEHAPGLEVQPVGDGSRRPGRLRRGVGDVPLAQGHHLVPVVLGGLRPGFGQVGDLVGVRHPEVPRAGEAAAALAPALREHVLGLVRAGVPRQVCPRRARLLARLPLVPGAAAGLALRGLLPGQVIRRGRHRGVPAVAGQRTFQPRHLLRSAAIWSACAPIASRSSPISSSCAAIRSSRAAQAAQSGAGDGRADTGNDHQEPGGISKPTRRADDRTSKPLSTASHLNIRRGGGWARSGSSSLTDHASKRLRTRRRRS